MCCGTRHTQKSFDDLVPYRCPSAEKLERLGTSEDGSNVNTEEDEAEGKGC